MASRMLGNLPVRFRWGLLVIDNQNINLIIETQIIYPYLLGYSGMQPIYLIEKFVFLKPFLYLSKDKIINYANQKKISFLEDETNQNDYYSRNRIRKFVIPYLQKEHNFLKNIYKFHIQITEIYQLVKEQTNLFFDYLLPTAPI
ncbi:ATP-binding protein [Candidatus Phytoplasma australasiaticum]